MDEKNVTVDTNGISLDKELIKANWWKIKDIEAGKLNTLCATSTTVLKEKEQREKQEKHIRTLSTFIAWTIGYALMAVIHYYVLGDFIRDVLNISPIFVSRLYTIGALIMLFCTFIVSLKKPS